MTAGIDCQLVRNAGDWPSGLETLAQRCVDAAVAEIPLHPDGPAELSVLLTDDAEQRALNARWRQIDKPTNVLSFPALQLGTPLAGTLGDVSLAFETLAREAALEDRSFEHHFAHLLVHGFLHILGYDHTGEADADAMEALETRILARLSVPDPHAAVE